MKFKVGDKVRLIAKRTPRDYRTSIKEGFEYIITSINPNESNPEHHYGVKNVNGVSTGWIVYEDELKLIESKRFTKSDLKDGMVVETRRGDLMLVNGSRMLTRTCFMNFRDYEEDLTCDSRHREFDIVKVHTVMDNSATNIFELVDPTYLNLIWERKEEPSHKEMTVEEIEKELGYKIKVIADKE